MKKIFCIGLILCLSYGMLFAEDTAAEKGLPQNTVSFDVGSAAFSLLYSGVGLLSSDASSTSSAWLNLGIQFERQLSGHWSLGGRLGYNGMIWFDNEHLSALLAEVHARYYPKQKAFFLDGMLGYGNLQDQRALTDSVSHYALVGGKVGWRIDFGKPGGLVLEPSFGYYWAIGRTNIEVNDDINNPFGWLDVFNLWATEFMARYLLVGGPRFSLCLGYRF